MKTILNRIGAIRVTPACFFGFWAVLFALVFSLTSCSDDLDVQQSYPFTVEVMPYGTLKLVDGPTLVNNDRVLIESKQFRLNYTARSTGSHELLVTVEDNYGTHWEQTFEFNNNDSDDNGGTGSLVVTPINPGTLTPIGK